MKFPNAWIAKEKSKVEARIDMSAEVAGEGKCPACKQAMKIVFVEGSRMWACSTDRITVPLPNDYNQEDQKEGR